MTFHHVLRVTDALDGERPVYVRLRATDEWQDPAPDRYRVVGCSLPLRADFCFISRDGKRMCTVGAEHFHRDEHQGLGRGWEPSELSDE